MTSYRFDVFVPEGSDLKNPGVTKHEILSDVAVPTRATIKDHPRATYIGVFRMPELDQLLQESDLVGVYLVCPEILTMDQMLAEVPKGSSDPQNLANAAKIRQAGPAERWYKWVWKKAVAGFTSAHKSQSEWDLVCSAMATNEEFRYAPVSDTRLHVLDK